MNFEHYNEQIRSLRNELQGLKNEPFPYTTGQEIDIEQVISDLQDEISFYSNVYTQLAALYPNVVKLSDVDSVSKRDYLRRYDSYDPSQAIRMIVQELTTRFDVAIDFPTTYTNKRKQTEAIEISREHTELNQIVFDAMRQSEMWLKDHPTEDSKHIQNLARATWNSGNYSFTRNGVDSFINHLRRVGALPPVTRLGMMKNTIMEKLDNV